MLEKWEKGRQICLTYMQIYLDRNMEELFVTISVFVPATCPWLHLVFRTTFSYGTFRISLPLAITLARGVPCLVG